uniref:Uncharacterized protein n=1 Tax=Oryza glumipatula TaxID=40148 RepID=A0A0D9YMW4_9ORYZ
MDTVECGNTEDTVLAKAIIIATQSYQKMLYFQIEAAVQDCLELLKEMERMNDRYDFYHFIASEILFNNKSYEDVLKLIRDGHVELHYTLKEFSTPHADHHMDDLVHRLVGRTRAYMPTDAQRECGMFKDWVCQQVDKEYGSLGYLYMHFLDNKMRAWFAPFPEVLKDLKYSETHEWVSVEGDYATIGISDHAQACPKLIEWFREREENVKSTEPMLAILLLFSPRWLLKQEVPKVVKSINRQLREKSIKTKDKSSTSNLKIEALVFTRLVMASHSPAVFHPYIQALSGPILSAIGDRYDKVTAEALRVCEELVRVFRPNSEPHSPDYRPYIGPIYKAILARLANQDQEVKECAISCMSLALSTFGDGLQRELPACLPVLVDRMGNEITRLTAVKFVRLFLVITHFHNSLFINVFIIQILESIDDLTLIRYLIKWIPAQPWADGEIYLYSPDTHSWSSQGMKMKFFIMDEKYNMEAKGIYKKIDELVSLANHSMFLAPVFALHDKKIGRIILCYPKFDQLLKDWLPAQAFKGRFIPPIWMHLIKDVISYMSNIDNLAASLGSIDSYVLETKPERIKVILFPFESREVNWRKDFATFLIEHLRNKWKSTMLDHFINILQKDFKIGDIQHHPLLQDFDQLSNMIRMTWKESKYLTVERRVLLSSTLNAIRNNIPWTSVTTMDAVVNEYISKATNDSLGLFTEIKKIAAHYIENRRKLNKEKGICNRKQVHPIEIIEEIWPGAIEEIYELSLKSEWLTT